MFEPDGETDAATALWIERNTLAIENLALHRRIERLEEELAYLKGGGKTSVDFRVDL